MCLRLSQKEVSHPNLKLLDTSMKENEIGSLGSGPGQSLHVQSLKKDLVSSPCFWTKVSTRNYSYERC